MKLGILETGYVPEEMITGHGGFPEMFGALFCSADPSIQIAAYPVADGTLPDSPNACDAWLVTGSKHGVYDNLPWMAPLKTFLRTARSAGVPMIGICFGHQIMAEAFGGRAEKSGKGWGCGVHGYEVQHRPGWMGDTPSAFDMHAMHQDQVTAIPEDATVLATSAFCENAMLTYGDPEQPDAISIQPHPEFTTPFARDLVETRKGTVIADAVADVALESLGRDVANQAFARWAVAYLRDALARKAAA
ncbi:MAG: type 1 glutamine amidotransferase [Pseudomonadota bacterium]